MGEEKSKKICTGRLLKIAEEFSREVSLVVLSIQSHSSTSETSIHAHCDPWLTQNVLNKAGGFIIGSRGKNKAGKVIRPKSCCYVPVFAWLIEAKADNQGLFHHSKVLVSRAHRAPVIMIFICFAESKQQISR